MEAAMAGTKHDAELFVNRWSGIGNEDQDTQLFWIGLFQDVLGLENALDLLKFEQPVHTAASEHKGFIDVLIPSAKTIVEQKSYGKDLSKQDERQDRHVNAAQQALGYVGGMALSQKPRYIIACNFEEFWIYDTEVDPLCKGEPLKIKLSDLPSNLSAIQFLAGEGEAPDVIQRKVDVEAGRIMGKIHEAIAESFEAADFDRNDVNVHHAISSFCTRIMFLMFCEDQAGLLKPNCFRNYIQHYSAEDLRKALLDLFEWLDTPDEERDPFASDLLKAFPYINGGLFAERTQIPTLSETLRTTIIVEGCQEFDWSSVNPTVFGSIFEGSLSHDERRNGGMHYTSPENIHKVIDPLFLDSLEKEFTDACSRPQIGGARTRALEDLHNKIGNINILDPACGSGNFLTESYICLRRLENQILLELSKNGQMSFTDESTGYSPVLVSLKNFHGIEINDFACAVARTALWIAEKQADADTLNIVRQIRNELPLTDYGTIHQGNALRMNWNDVVQVNDSTYICGNPPFIGQYTKSSEQTADTKFVWAEDYDGYLDYATCWYRKAAFFYGENNGKFAFVSTNSICQGQPVPALFGPLWKEGWEVSFAHRTFVWDTISDDEAHVHVVILGFEKNPQKRTLFYYDHEKEMVLKSHPENINGYLCNAPNVLVKKQMKPISNISAMIKGSAPVDGGFLQIKTIEEYNEAMTDPIAAKYIRPCLGATELINSKKRWCLWLENASPADLINSAFLNNRIIECRNFRLSSDKPATRKAAEKPWIWGESRPALSAYLCVPSHFSGERRYFTAARCTNGEIATNACFIAYDPDGLLFSIISSRVFMTWQKAIGGELKSDCRFSNTIVWNNFPVPDLTKEQKKAIIEAGELILDTRDLYKGMSLATLYKSSNEFLFPKLFDAHRALDVAIESAYGIKNPKNEDEIITHLLNLYVEKIGTSTQ